jgi:hypothetical protein
MILDCNYSPTNGLWFIIIHVLTHFPSLSLHSFPNTTIHSKFKAIILDADIFLLCFCFPFFLLAERWNCFFLGTRTKTVLMKVGGVIAWLSDKNHRWPFWLSHTHTKHHYHQLTLTSLEAWIIVIFDTDETWNRFSDVKNETFFFSPPTWHQAGIKWVGRVLVAQTTK